MGLAYCRRAHESCRECNEKRACSEDTLRLSKDRPPPFGKGFVVLLVRGWNKEARFHSYNHPFGNSRLRVNEAR